MTPQPEQQARAGIDRLLQAAGWAVQDAEQANIHVARGMAIREFPLKTGHGFADYLLYVDGKAAGVVEAKKQGVTLTGVETQSAKYTQGLPDVFPCWRRPLPFAYQSTGIETRFTNGLDPTPRSRPVFAFHRPEQLAEWLKANVLFFDKKPASETPWTRKLWIYDLRTNRHFTLKTNPLKREDLDDFVKCYVPEAPHLRAPTWSEENPTGRWRAYEYGELINRDKASLDIFWLKDETLEESESLPDPGVLAAEIVEDLQAALEQFREIAQDLEPVEGNPI